MLCLLLAVPCAIAEEGESDYTLPEKFWKQVELGSGLKGVAKAATSGDGAMVLLFSPLNNTEFQFESILSDGKLECEVYTVKNEIEGGRTLLFSDQNRFYLNSTLLLGTTYSLPLNGDLITSLTSSHPGEPTLLSALFRILRGETDESGVWDTSMERFRKELQTWLDSYASSPVLSSSDAQSTLFFQYTIPEKALREQLQKLVMEMMADPSLLTLMRRRMDDAQKEAYLGNEVLEKDLDMILQMQFSGDIRITRTVTLQGQEIDMTMVLPFAQNPLKIREIQFHRSTTTDWTILTDDAQFELHFSELRQTGDSSAFAGTFRQVLTGSIPAFSLSFDLSSTTIRNIDDESVHHEYNTLQFTLQNDLSHLSEEDSTRADYATVPTIQGTFQTHFSSKAAKRAATTLDVSLDLNLPGGRFQAAAKMKTVTPWELKNPTVEESVDMSTMSVSQRIGILRDLLSSAYLDLSLMDLEKTLEMTDAVETSVSETIQTPTDLTP